MGTYINLSILPSSISKLEWEEVYEESLMLLKTFPFADVAVRTFCGYELPVYVKAEEKKDPKRHWTVSGDLESKRFAETFTLYRDIRHYQHSKLESNHKDILFNEEKYKSDIFNSKTQGYEYHLYLLAIAMLIESRLPMKAIVSGNIDYEQCVKAKEWADKYLSSPIDIPVRVDADSLLSRAIHLKNELEQIQFIKERLIADQEEIFNVIYTKFAKNTFMVWFCDELKAYTSPNQVGALKILIHFLNIAADLDELLNLICKCKSQNGPKYSDSEVARAIARTWICLPREKFSFLDGFARIPGHPQVVERQFGTSLLDMMFTGREIKTYIVITKVSNILEGYLTYSKSEIEQLLKQEVMKIEVQLLDFHNQILPALEITEASTEDKMYLADEDAFLYYDGKTIFLTDEQEFALKATAYSIKNFLNQTEGDLKKILSEPLEKIKMTVAVFASEKYHMVLTEQAWRWIDETEDILLIKILLVTLIIDDVKDLVHLKFHSDIRKAILENKYIIEEIAEYMDNESIMMEIEKVLFNTR